MNKYEKAINYFFSQMEKGLIENDEQQDMYEMAIDALTKLNNQKKINKDSIIINSIVPTYITKQYVGEETEIIITKLDVESIYNGTKTNTPIVTDRINIEEIKDKIIEVLQ